MDLIQSHRRSSSRKWSRLQGTERQTDRQTRVKPAVEDQLRSTYCERAAYGARGSNILAMRPWLMHLTHCWPKKLHWNRCIKLLTRFPNGGRGHSLSSNHHGEVKSDLCNYGPRPDRRRISEEVQIWKKNEQSRWTVLIDNVYKYTEHAILNVRRRSEPPNVTTIKEEKKRQAKRSRRSGENIERRRENEREREFCLVYFQTGQREIRGAIIVVFFVARGQPR